MKKENPQNRIVLEQFRKFDEKHNRLLLSDEYIFAYTKSDGFSHRLLSGEFVVDWQYNYKLRLSAFQHHEITSNNSDVLLEAGILEGDKLERFEQFLGIDFAKIKQIYDFETFEVSDIGGQQFLINIDRITKHIGIIDGLTNSYFETPAEQILFDYNEYLKSLIENKYEKWLMKKNC